MCLLFSSSTSGGEHSLIRQTETQTERTHMCDTITYDAETNMDRQRINLSIARSADVR